MRNKFGVLLFTLCELFALTTLASAAIFLKGKYDGGNVQFTDDINVLFAVDREAKRIAFALHVQASVFVNSSSKAAWVGIGIGEESSGAMLGADIATVEFAAGDLDSCLIKDRYVPFVAYPLQESTPDSPSVFPEEDDCQNDGSWELVQCARDDNGTVLFEVERSLEAHDSQDREVKAGMQALLYAYGSSFGYHGGNRGTTRVVFFNEDGSPVKDYSKIPDDANFNFSIVASEYSVPSDRDTTYACTSQEVDTGPNGVRYLVGAEPILDQIQGKNLAHHFLVYACAKGTYFSRYRSTKPCFSDAEVGNPEAGCTSLLYTWAVGGQREILPEDVAFTIDDSNKYLIMETHYDNPDRDPDVLDVSGARLFFSDTPRKFEAGTLFLGDGNLSLINQTVVSEFEYQFTCPSNCTNEFKQPINVFGSLLHMHRTGRKVYTNRFGSDGEFIEHMNSIEYWSNEHQTSRLFVPPRKINPGDILSTTCIYDTSKLPATKFGFETADEMCSDILQYWPAQRRNATDGTVFRCGLMTTEREKENATCCGITLEPEWRNPSLNDTVDTPDLFGRNVDVCEAPRRTKASDTCFPGSATIELCHGKQKRMEDLEIGDRVLVEGSDCSEVLMFTHRIHDICHKFVALYTESGQEIMLTESHFLYVNGGLRAAKDVRVGDMLELLHRDATRVIKVRSTFKKGLFNPQTVHGDIVVNGIRASTYTRSVNPNAAHALLAPLRFLHKKTGWSTGAFDNGAAALAHFAHWVKPRMPAA